MPNIFNRYIIKQVLYSTLLVIAIMLALSFIITLLGEFQDMGRGEYHFAQAVIYVALRLPHTIYQFSPMLILLGGILGLGVLTAHQELMVIRGSGFSLAAILRAMMYAAVVLIFLMMLLGEWVAPRLDHQAAITKQNAKNNGQAVVTSTGIWLHEGNDFFHVERVMGQHHLQGVTRYQFNREHQLIAAYHADSMDYQERKWFLQGIEKTVFLPSVGTKSSYIKQDIWNFTLSPNLLILGMAVPEEMTLKQLLTVSHHLVKNGLQAAPFQLAFWQRVLQPFAIIIMLLLAVPFVLGAPRSSTLGLRIFMGIVVGFIFYLCNAFFGQLSIIFQFSPWLAAVLPMVLFSGVGYGVLRWMR